VDPFQTVAAVGSGVIVGFTLGLVGGGGSILAVPLLLYVVGIPDPHQAIGTSALAVAVNAFANLVPHARALHVRWRPALNFAAAGLVGAFVGSSIGKVVDGRRLLILFALLMLVIAVLMLRGRKADTSAAGAVRQEHPWRLKGIGLGVGTSNRCGARRVSPPTRCRHERAEVVDAPSPWRSASWKSSGRPRRHSEYNHTLLRVPSSLSERLAELGRARSEH
jgi:hypothetical protein